MHRRIQFRTLTAALALALAGGGLAGGLLTASGPAAAGSPAAGWVATWGASAMSPSPLASSVQALSDQTVRNIVHTSTGGTELRIRVSNAFGDREQTITAATVARQLRGAEADPTTVRPLTFGGRPSTTVARGGSALSDPVRTVVPARSNLAISLYLPGSTGPATYHQSAMQTNYLAPGDHASDPGGAAFTTTATHSFFLDAVQVRSAARGAIIAVGDSITDGVGGQHAANTRWPDFLARRLAERHGPAAPAVVNEGISGNRILNDSECFGVKLLDRLDRDVLSHPGARAVVLLEGINDLGFSQEPNEGCLAPNTDVTPEQLIAAYRQIIERVHAKGLPIYGGTLTQAEGFGYWSDAAERKRIVVNEWIRTSGAFDGVVDFAALLAYPGHPNLLDPKYDSGDHLHPNDAGFEAMAAAVDRTLKLR